MKKIDMAKIGPSSGTRPERIVRLWLVRNGLRHSCQARVEGVSVDFLVGGRLALFVDGRFWHCPESKAKKISRFWREKIERNVRRDRRNNRRLNRAGFRVLRVWDSDLRRTGWQARISKAAAPDSVP